MQKFLFATFLGRAPRVWFFATLGLLIPVSTQVLVTCAVAAVVAGVVVALHRGPRALLRSGLVAGGGARPAWPRNPPPLNGVGGPGPPGPPPFCPGDPRRSAPPGSPP